MRLTNPQSKLVRLPLPSKLFLSGPAGTGKTTVGVRRAVHLLASGVPSHRLLLLTPQRSLQDPYLEALHTPDSTPGGVVTSATMGGLARRMCDLFWPLAAEAAGFAHPERPPVFLTIETAQYHMARLVRPLLAEGYFQTLTIDRNRLYAQLLDNLNKSAGVGFPYTEIGARLESAWFGEPSQRRIYAEAQECASRFRAHCLELNLLDFSLQLELFAGTLWRLPQVRSYLQNEYRHLIYDNVEEDAPVAHDLLSEWLPEFDSALIIFDQGAGYRRFLGADPQSAERLAQGCTRRAELERAFVAPPAIQALAVSLVDKLTPGRLGAGVGTPPEAAKRPYQFLTARFFPAMLEAVAGEIQRLTAAGQPPSGIVVLAPYLSDALRFSLGHRLDEAGIPWRSQRPSRSLRDEPACRCLLTLAALAHPRWDLHPARFDVASALRQALDGLDLVRAQLLSEIVYRERDLGLSSFDRIRPEVQARITFVFGERYSRLRDWLLAYRQTEPLPLDHFLRRLFGELLSQPGFGFHRRLDSARLAASLIESIQKFRQALDPVPTTGPGDPDFDLGCEYLQMLQEGVIAAQYLETRQELPAEAVLISPASTFLMMNRPADVQFWLDVGSSGWWERLAQPLTQPYVLSRPWMDSQPGRLWTDADETAANQETLARLLTGLLRRCRKRVYLGISGLGEQGFEQRGPLLKALWKLQLENQPR